MLAGDTERLFRQIDTIEVLSVEFQIQQNTLSIATEEVEVYWAPAGAVSAADGGALFGIVPSIAASETGEGTVALDADGLAAFTNYFETVGHRFRFFAKSEVDLEPGQAFPEGDLDVAVRMSVRVSGALL